MTVLRKLACGVIVREKSGSYNQLRDRENLRNLSIMCYEFNTVEPSIATTSRKGPLLSNQSSKIPKDCKSNY